MTVIREETQQVRCAELREGDVLWPTARRVERVIGRSASGIYLALQYSDERHKPHTAVFQAGTRVSILKRHALEGACRECGEPRVLGLLVCAACHAAGNAREAS
jgi:hypothetical protein